MKSLVSLMAPFTSGVNMTGLSLWGAHHRVLADNGIAAGNCAWATGDLAHEGNGNRNQYLGEMGVCTDIDNFRLGAGVGLSRVDQDLAFGGDSNLDGYYFVGEADYTIPGTSVVASLTGYAGNWNAEISRHYLNGVTVDASRGETDARSWALRARLDWLKAVDFGPAALSPYVAYTHTRNTVDGYTESGGGFPVAVDDYSQTAREGRLGTALQAALSDTTDLRVSGEWVHRFDNDAPVVTGAILGNLGSFSTPGLPVDRNWARFGADLDQRIGDNSVITVSVHTATGDGEDAAVSGSIGLRLGF